MSGPNQIVTDTRQKWAHSAVDTLEQFMHADIGDLARGQNLKQFFEKTQGSLLAAAESIASTDSPVIRILTGFYIEKAKQAETDGILAAAQMVYFFKLAGIDCCITTDSHCAAVCKAALAEVGCPEQLEVISTPHNTVLDKEVQAWKDRRVTHAISIERPGPSFSDGLPYNMEGEVIRHCAPLHQLFSGGAWKKIGIADRGNEIGSGSLPQYIIAQDIRNGRQIACETGADHLLVSRVSNWAASALTAAVALLGPKEWPTHLNSALDCRLLERVLVAMVQHGAVDGITLNNDATAPTVDTLPLKSHIDVTKGFLKAVKHAVGGRNIVPTPHRPTDTKSLKGILGMGGLPAAA